MTELCLGRLAVKAPADRFPLKYAHEYLAAPLPAPAYPIDVSGGITFDMLGNDTYGDCGEVGIRNLERTTAAGAGQPVPSFTTQDAVNEYFAFTGGQDTGVNLADFLLWLWKKGRIKAFAPVDHTNRPQADGLMQVGHGLYVGVNLTDQDQALFGTNQEWVAGTPDHNLGHCILKVKADGQSTDGYVTWARVQPATTGWTDACVEEAWLVVTTEEQMAAFTPQLLADINALHGTGGAPNPAPAPVPTPTPAPKPTQKTLLAEVVALLKQAISYVERVVS